MPFEQNFYYPQEDFLAVMQEGQKWTWNVIRPEAIIGKYNCIRIVDRPVADVNAHKATPLSQTA